MRHKTFRHSVFAYNTHAVCFQLHIPLRLLCGGLLFTCNAVMWTFLAKALRYSSSSTQTTVTTTASNFISSVSNRLFYRI